MSVAITEQLEHTRQLIADEMKATKEEIVFVRGCTEGHQPSSYLLRARHPERRRRGGYHDDGPRLELPTL
jgi:selenocysteine lyase/cysteine desulfurase